MLVAITGATGFIGSHTAIALHAAGHRVRALVRDPTKLKRVFDARQTVVDDFVVGDVTDPDSVARLLDGCDAVVHTAALVSLERARAGDVQQTNTPGVELVVGGAVARGFQRIVYVSSAGALFRLGGTQLTGDSPIGDSSSAYGASKADAERYVRRLQDDGAPILTTYPTAVIGPDDPTYTDPNRGMAFMVQWGGPRTTTGYQPVDVRDLAQLHAALLEGERATGRYIAAGPYYPWTELFSCIEGLTGRRVRQLPVPGPVLRGIGIVSDWVKHWLHFDLPLTHEAMQFATCWPIADGTPAGRDFGLHFRRGEDTLADTYRWLHTAGHLTRKQIGDLAADL
jgi:nucleoside-diphosphate-sugar epimerase